MVSLPFLFYNVSQFIENIKCFRCGLLRTHFPDLETCPKPRNTSGRFFHFFIELRLSRYWISISNAGDRV